MSSCFQHVTFYGLPISGRCHVPIVDPTYGVDQTRVYFFPREFKIPGFQGFVGAMQQGKEKGL